MNTTNIGDAVIAVIVMGGYVARKLDSHKETKIVLNGVPSKDELSAVKSEMLSEIHTAEKRLEIKIKEISDRQVIHAKNAHENFSELHKAISQVKTSVETKRPMTDEGTKVPGHTKKG